MLWKHNSKALSQAQRIWLMSSLPGDSALTDLFIQTQKDGDLKSKSSLTKMRVWEALQWADRHHLFSTQIENEGDKATSHVSHW